MSSERLHLLGPRSRYGAIGEDDHQKFFSDHLSRLPTCMSFLSRSLIGTLNRSRRSLKHWVVPIVHFERNQPDRVFTRYISDACFDNTAFSVQPGVPLTSLDWLTLPVSRAVENYPIPPFSVQANARSTEEITLIVHSCENGMPRVTGPTQIPLRSQGPDKPSVAVFRDIAIARAGRYVVEVRSCNSPHFSVLADIPLIVEPNLAVVSGKNLRRTLSEEIGRLSMIGLYSGLE
ncbi:hypothetical protein BV898_07481 [Hypsibius exemplaris]|uniref:Uncharacterized protein n=1 Tax=Hypsibius exemplaris TaxID=2072580 RepID=A0A1W0WTF1_HYPEX|nr:hypothetical protein BV898_07481 [Hypsibius exemplaris]